MNHFIGSKSFGLKDTLRGAVLMFAGGMLAVVGLSSTAHADALHGFCYGTTPTCSDNGTNTPTATNPPSFGFWASSGPDLGTYYIDVLVPDVGTAPGSFSITGTQGGKMNNSSISATASLFSNTAWTTGQLDSYLSISGSPANPIGGFLPATQTYDPAATGFWVFQADLGQNTLAGSAGNGPLLNLSGSLPQGSYLVAFLDTGDKKNVDVATANSGAILETGVPTAVTPEPESLVLLCTGLLGTAGLIRRRFGF